MTTTTFNESVVLPDANAAREKAQELSVVLKKRLGSYMKRLFTVSDGHRKLTQQPHWQDCW